MKKIITTIMMILGLISSHISLSVSSMFNGIHDGLSILFLIVGITCAGVFDYMLYLLVKEIREERM